MGADLAVDFGTARTLVAVRGRGVVVDEPTFAAVDLGRNRLVAFGNRALSLRGRCAGDVAFIRPVCHGQLADLDLTWAVARELLRVVRTWSASQPTVLCCASGAATGVQRRALDRAFKEAGAGNVRFVEQQVAVALGSGLRIEEPVASMVVDVGAGTTEIGVLALGGLVTQASVPVGGGDFDEAIQRFCVRDFELVIDLETAEAVKRAIGSAWVEEDDKVEVRGRDVSSGIVRAVVITRTEVADAIAPPRGPDRAGGRLVHRLGTARSCERPFESRPLPCRGWCAPCRLRQAARVRDRHPGPPRRESRALCRRRSRLVHGHVGPQRRIGQSPPVVMSSKSSAA